MLATQHLSKQVHHPSITLCFHKGAWKCFKNGLLLGGAELKMLLVKLKETVSAQHSAESNLESRQEN